MANYQVKLLRREEIASGTMAFFFEKPAGFNFSAGQFMRFSLIEPPETDDEGDSRTFSLASAPHEPFVMIATRMRDTAFKRVLRSMLIGSAITAKGPYGKMTLHEDETRPAVILTGGIGITPFRSIAIDATHRESGHRIYLFYSNRRPEDAAFLTELAATAAVNHRLTFIPTMTSAVSEWTGKTGHINADLLMRTVENRAGAIYYIAGPQGLVNSMRRILAEAGIQEADIRSEEFAG